MPRSASVPERFIYEERSWARDTFGLSNDQYRELNYANFFFFSWWLKISLGYISDKKTQTTKDLAKPWVHIPSLIPNQSLPENLNSDVDATDKDNHPSIPQQQQQHSALTTSGSIWPQYPSKKFLR